MPQVSVVIPTYNRREMVRVAVASALAQTLPDVEVIVIDDGSTDGTSSALRREFGDSIQVVEQPNQGESSARNYGVTHARASLIAFLDSDDLWVPEKLALQASALDSQPGVVLVSTWSQMVDVHGNPMQFGHPPQGPEIDASSFGLAEIGLRNPFSSGPSAVMARREAILSVGGFDGAIRYAEDYDLWLRLRLIGEFDIVPVLLTSKRHHGASQTNHLTAEAIDDRLEAHVSMTDRFFDQWPVEPPAGLRERCIARRYMTAALKDYVIGRCQLGQARFAHAVALDNELSRRDECMLELDFGWLMTGQIEMADRSLPATTEIFDDAMRNWPPALSPIPKDVRRWLVEEIFGPLGWQYAQRGEWRSARRCLLRQIAINPSLLLNRGVWSVFARSLRSSR